MTARACATSASADGRIAAIGDLSPASAGETIDCRGPAHPARRHRQPGAFPRAGPGAQGRPRNRLARGRARRRHRRLRDAEHQSADHQRGSARRQGRARHRPHALRLRLLGRRHARQCRRRRPNSSACRARPASRSSWARRPATCWSRTTTASPSILRNTRRRAAFHSEDEFRLRERLGERVAGDPSSHPVWRDEIAALRCTERLVAHRPRDRAPASMCCTSRPPRRSTSSQQHKDVATCEVTPHHLTLAADDYARLGTLLQMNPPVRDAAPSRRRLARHRAGHRRRARLRPRAAHAGGEGASPIRPRPPA